MRNLKWWDEELPDLHYSWDIVQRKIVGGSQMSMINIYLHWKSNEIRYHAHKERLYFTFPVITKRICQILMHFHSILRQRCVFLKKIHRKGEIYFEAETYHSRQFPGFSACSSGSSGNGRFVLIRPSCNFHQVRYEPEFLNSYEVAKLIGHLCKYHVSVINVKIM